MARHQPIRVGVAGPVGAGKTRLIECLLPLCRESGLRSAVITNDLVTKEDAQRLQRSGLIDPQLVVGVETGACPHSAIREDPSMNIAAAQELERAHGPLDLIFIESGGDNLAATFSRDLADYWMFMIDCAMGDDIPRKRGLGLIQADLLVVNKTDLAPFVGADVDLMRRDVARIRPDAPSVFTELRGPSGGQSIFAEMCRALGLDSVVARGC